MCTTSQLTYPEKGGRGSAAQCSVFDFGLLGQVLGALDGRVHALDGEEGGKVGRVRGDHDQREEPPHPSDHSCGDGPFEWVGVEEEQRLGLDGMGIDWVKVRIVLIKVGQFILIPFLDLSTK